MVDILGGVPHLRPGLSRDGSSASLPSGEQPRPSMQGRGSASSARPPQVERLEEVLMEQVAENEQLNREMRARDWERWQLLQLLHQKDEQLSYEQSNAARQRAVLTSARGSARYYQVMCVLRAWHFRVLNLRSDRTLMRAKGRLATSRVRHACGAMRMVLLHGTGRPIRVALHALWLNAARHGDEVPGGASSSANIGSALGSGDARAKARAAPRAASQGSLDSLAGPVLPPKGAPLAEPPEDQVVFVSPRQGPAAAAGSRSQARWESSPCARAARCLPPAPSETSTCAPSSLSHSVAGSSLPMSSLALVRLVLSLKCMGLRRLFWATGRLKDSVQQAHAMEHLDSVHAARAEEAHQRARAAGEAVQTLQTRLVGSHRIVESLTSELSQVEFRWEEDQQEAHARLETWRSQWLKLESRAHSMSIAETRLSSQLQEKHLHQEALARRNSYAEEQIAKQWNSEQAARHAEQQVVGRLAARIQEFEEDQAELAVRGESERASCSRLEQRLRSSEHACAKLEARLAHKARWRAEAQQQIHQMVICGEGLEHERAHLRQELIESRQRYRARGEHLETLRSELAQEEQLGEILKARMWVLEQDNAELAVSSELEQRCRVEDAARHDAELAAMQRERAELCAAARSAAQLREAAEGRASEATRRSLLAQWSQERHEWRQRCADLELQVESVEEELGSVRRAEVAEACTAADAHRCSRAYLERVESLEVAQAAAAKESELCAHMKTELECQVAQAQRLQADLGTQLARVNPPPAEAQHKSEAHHKNEVPLAAPQSPHALYVGSSESGPDSGPPTPQLNELDAYAELVERLRAEVCRERAEREASVNSLATLRGSYRLLLQRASVCNTGTGPLPGVGHDTAVGESLPPPWTVH